MGLQMSFYRSRDVICVGLEMSFCGFKDVMGLLSLLGLWRLFGHLSLLGLLSLLCVSGVFSNQNAILAEKNFLDFNV